jgi:hypothetical protein
LAPQFVFTFYYKKKIKKKRSIFIRNGPVKSVSPRQSQTSSTSPVSCLPST